MKTRLPRGVFSGDGVCHRAAVLRPLTGYHEAMLAAGPPDPDEVSHLLSDRLIRVGGLSDLSPRRVAAMTCGDRAHLLLVLRAAAVGDAIRLSLRCPSPACGADAVLVLDTAALCATSEPAAPNILQASTSAGRVMFREPTGEDAAALVGVPAPERAARLWSRLVQRLGERAGIAPRDWAGLPPAVRHTIAVALDEQRRGPRLSGHHACPRCGAGIPWGIDAGALLAAELREGAARLAEDVHAFAWHYGWSEADTLALPRQRRWNYLRRLRLAVEAHQ